jgi:hypothetical protein
MPNELSKVKSLFKNLRRQSVFRFPKPKGTLDAATKRGVYLIINPSGKVVHVGRTTRAKFGIYQRLYDHLNGRSSFVYKYRPLHKKGSSLRKGYKYQYLVVENGRQRALLEAYAMAHLCPKHLGLGR